MSELGKFLIVARGNVTLRVISEKTGISHTYIRDLELGKKNNPSKEVLEKIALVYNVSSFELAKLNLKDRWIK